MQIYVALARQGDHRGFWNFSKLIFCPKCQRQQINKGSVEENSLITYQYVSSICVKGQRVPAIITCITASIWTGCTTDDIKRVC